MIRRILVANRGEIAVRIMRTCREMGVETVAIYTEVDRETLHVSMAERSVCLGAVERYIDAGAIIAAALETGVDAVHPGYGFLSENADFARLCALNNLVFIGPRASTIDLMGHKRLAREAVRKAGVPVVPGSEGPLSSESEALAEARRIGFPVMIKAVAGGGGRGMRAANDETCFSTAFAHAVSEALSTTGNPEVYLEKYMHNFRHVEMQIMADKYGNAVYLGERDCSIQRRHQKLIEETPSPGVSSSLRRDMGRSALRVVQAVNYTNAGTVEFIVDQDGRYYFMEMNTRIQVEHAVTEMVAGIDLIREQIKLAAGLALDLDQEHITLSGCAIECRINAEDPDTFFPCPGQVQVFQPPGGYGVRVDSALFPGCVVPVYYDSLVAKLLVWGRDRKEAVCRMARALAEFRIEGIDTTIPFHIKVMENPHFRAGEYRTDFVHGSLAACAAPTVPPRSAVIEDAVSAGTPGRISHLSRRSLWRTVSMSDLMRPRE